MLKYPKIIQKMENCPKNEVEFFIVRHAQSTYNQAILD